MPPAVDRAWEMGVERDLNLTSGAVVLMGSQGNHPHLTPSSAPGLHRARIHVRDWAHGARPDDQLGAISAVNPEQHLIRIWPSLVPRAGETPQGPDAYASTYLATDPR